MAQAAKREAAIRRNPKAVRQEDLLAVLAEAGFDCRRGRRGHWTCVHIASQARCTFAEPHGRAEAFLRPVYVRDALAALDASRLAGKADDESASE